MKRLWLVFGATAVLAVGAAAQAPKTRTIHISVTDDEGAPVTGLLALGPRRRRRRRADARSPVWRRPRTRCRSGSCWTTAP